MNTKNAEQKISLCERCGNERPPGRRHLCNYCRDHCPNCGGPRDPRRNTYCKPCATEWARNHRRLNPGYYAQKDREHRARNPERYRSLRREWNQKNPEKVRAMHLKKYGMTPERYEAMLRVQGGHCATCSATDPGRGRKYFFIDHDHDCCPTKLKCCGKCVRGLLCNRCNRVLGFLNDNTLILHSLSWYLRHWQERFTHLGYPSYKAQKSEVILEEEKCQF